MAGWKLLLFALGVGLGVARAEASGVFDGARPLADLTEAPSTLDLPRQWSDAVESAWERTRSSNREHGICFYRTASTYSAEIFAGGEDTITFVCRPGALGEAHTHPHSSYTAHSIRDVHNLRGGQRAGYDFHGIRGPGGFILSVRTSRSRGDCLPGVRRGFRNSLIAAATASGSFNAEQMWANQMLGAAQECGAVTYRGSDSRSVSLRQPVRYFWEADSAGAARVRYDSSNFVPILKSFLWLSGRYSGPVDLNADQAFRAAYRDHFGASYEDFGEAQLERMVASFIELEYNSFNVAVRDRLYQSNMTYRSGNRGLNIFLLKDEGVPAMRINLIEGALRGQVENGSQAVLDVRQGGYVDRITIHIPDPVSAKVVESYRILNSKGRYLGAANLLR